MTQCRPNRRFENKSYHQMKRDLWLQKASVGIVNVAGESREQNEYSAHGVVHKGASWSGIMYYSKGVACAIRLYLDRCVDFLSLVLMQVAVDSSSNNTLSALFRNNETAIPGHPRNNVNTRTTLLLHFIFREREAQRDFLHMGCAISFIRCVLCASSPSIW